MPNKLIKEKSPYLLQHANNPVDWYPWNDEAFKKAKEEDKPVFLSIGYSTCHWCHVMEKESFEDEEAARLMNDAFVSIKVDREERPDIDWIYMSVCQMLTGSGGWPLTIIMTPDKKPFFAGTYFPKTERFGRMGMMQLIPKIKEIWNSRREEIEKSADEISSSAAHAASSKGGGEKVTEQIFGKAFEEFKRRYDNLYGGFGTAPKFPTPHNLLFLLRYWKRSGDESSLAMAEKTLIEMRKGGIYDQLGFGFHRYSTDPKWLVPHFEKMLYDQAQLCIAYTEAYQASKNDLFKQTAKEILTYVLRDMTSPEGGFFSAEDADSEGEEGKFYLWSEDEVRQILDDEADFFINTFSITKEGNWVDPMHSGQTGTNIPHLTKSFEKLAEGNSVSVEELKNKIEPVRKKLFYYREKRIHPYKDDKILTDWNGLMISAFSKAAQAFNNSEYKMAAEKAAKFILSTLKNKDGRLIHRYRDGEAGLPAHVEDYAFLIQGLLDLYEAVFDPAYLIEAISLNEIFIDHFWDKQNGGFFFTADDGEKLIVRQKEMYDGAIPSGNSAALLNLLRLGRITGNAEYEKKAEELVDAFSKQMNTHPSAFTQALCGLDFALSKSFEIVIAGENTAKFLNSINEKFLPNKIILIKNEMVRKNIEEIAPFTKEIETNQDKTKVYVCENYKCNMPVDEISALEKFFDNIDSY